MVYDIYQDKAAKGGECSKNNWTMQLNIELQNTYININIDVKMKHKYESYTKMLNILNTNWVISEKLN